jgi:hypothetical protein
MGLLQKAGACGPVRNLAIPHEVAGPRESGGSAEFSGPISRYAAIE